MQNISEDSIRFNSQIKVLADSENNNGILEDSFSFSYHFSSIQLYSDEFEEVDTLGQVNVEEAFQTTVCVIVATG